MLAGYSIEESSTDGKVTLMLHWRGLAPLAEDYTLFVHALDATGQMLVQADGQPNGGRLPTSAWEAGETVIEIRELAVPPGQAVAGLRVGWYLLATMQRLPAVDAAGQTSDFAYLPLHAGR